VPLLEGAAWAVATLWWLRVLDMAIGSLFLVPELRSQKIFLPPRPSKVSVLFAAKDEAHTVRPALESLLAQDYPDYEVIAVNDRSGDGTGEALRSFSDPKLRVIDVTALPGGWLGKTHALSRAHAASGGEWLLFTDADVLFAPSALSRAVSAALERRVDSVTLFPELARGGFLEEAFVNFFAHQFNLRYRPWAARFKAPLFYAGIGAFHLVSRRAYEAAGGHARLALEIADDMMLGKIVKAAGFRQILLSGRGEVSVRWVVGWRGVLSALHKNAFRGLDYSVGLLLAGTAVIFLTDVLPFTLLFSTAWRPWALTMCAAVLVSYLAAARHERRALLTYPAHPAVALLFLFILWRSSVAALRDGGVRWRDTFYPLDALRRARV